MRHSAEDVVYVVDWDIPTNPPGRRRAFYRALRKLRKVHGLLGRLSTASVLVVRDRDLAWAVYHLAAEYGTAHIYTAIQEA